MKITIPRTNFDPPSEPPETIPVCHKHDLPMEYDELYKVWYCPEWHYPEEEAPV